MTSQEVRRLYGLAHKLARAYKPFWLDYPDVIQEYAIAGWIAAESPHNKGGNERIHWGYVFKAMFNRFKRMMEKASKDCEGKIVLESTGWNRDSDSESVVDISDLQVTHDLIIPIPKDGEILETLIALATFPTDVACREALGVCINRWNYRRAQAKRFVEDNLS